MGDQLNLFSDAPRNIDPGEQILEPIMLDKNKDQARTASELVPLNSRFFVTQKYDITENLLGRLLRVIQETKEDKLSRKEISSILTIPNKRIDGLSAFATKAELITTNNYLTSFGSLALNLDPYLLNYGLLWFIHYLVVSNAQLILWSRLFNSVFYQVDEIKSSDVMLYFSDAQGTMNEKNYQKTGRDELKSVLSTYTDGLFKPLGLLYRSNDRKYMVITDEFPIPPAVWLASILAYRDRYYPGAVSLETGLLVEAHFSPGRLFRQNETRVRQMLDRMHNLGLLTVERGLGLDQVRFKREFTWLSAIAQHLQEAK
jgi:hypothetical protein